MSFKRDGDDKYALDALRKRRVSDLLYEDIEADEVSQLSNGRYICKACHHGPMFDTLSMFQVHKQGKKHQNSLEYQEQKKQELNDLIEKRKHEEFVKTGQTNIQQAMGPTTKHLGRGLPYDPRARRNRPKPYDRKVTLNLQASTPSDDDQAESSVSMEATSHDMLPGNRETNNHREKMTSSDSELYRKNTNGRTINSGATSAKTSNMEFRKSSVSMTTGGASEIQYSPCHQKHSLFKDTKCRLSANDSTEEKVMNAKSVKKLVDNSQSERCSKHYFARRQQTKIVVDPIPNRTEMCVTVSPNSCTKPWEYFKNIKGPSASVHKFNKDKKLGKNSTVVDSATSGYHDSIDMSQFDSGKDAGVDLETDKGTEEVLDIPVEKKERAEKFLQAFGSGWKRDWAGKWVKDDDAEFDSDEEPPDVV